MAEFRSLSACGRAWLRGVGALGHGGVGRHVRAWRRQVRGGRAATRLLAPVHRPVRPAIALPACSVPGQQKSVPCALHLACTACLSDTSEDV